ncbi:aa3-type cytochrome oxidase subunit CtaJ [Rhodococcus sp. WMMA185]|uniref:aa3-type cytochrome oxidase subunit CtaJ n=1 Tax=Rhodococcus sp. WMMA185 TaxID=679318 RepID=UPI0008791962|nr:hypothetical protein [Rhodococcus sp. WMMA185]
MSILETVLIFVGLPALISVFFAATAFVGKRTSGAVPPPFRLGEEWTHAPVLWSAVDEVTTHGHHDGHHEAPADSADLIGGSASGKW